MRDYKTIKYKNILKRGFFYHYELGSTNTFSNKQNVVMDEMEDCCKSNIQWSRDNLEEGYDEAVQELIDDKLVVKEDRQYFLTMKGVLFSALSRNDFKEASELWSWKFLLKSLLA